MSNTFGLNKLNYFKNFNMGRELEIAGEFIYESSLQMKALSFVGNHFNVNTILYNGAVGVERLQKILLCMNMSSDAELKNPLKCLKGHNHTELHKAIQESFNLNLDKNELALLELFRNYYDNFRYAEYKIDYNESQLCNILIKFINKKIGTNISSDLPCLEDEYKKMKSYYINLLGQIAYKYYNTIKNKANSLCLYTCEMNTDSNAIKVFYRNAEDKLYERLQLEDFALKELVIYLMHIKKKTKFIKTLKSVKTLNFDPFMLPEYLTDIVNRKNSILLSDFVEDAYTNLSEKELKNRKQLLDLISNSQVIWDY